MRTVRRSAWDSGEKRWEQHYTDTAGSSRYFLGRFEDGKLVMLTDFERLGAKVTSRMTYSKESGPRAQVPRDFARRRQDVGAGV